MQRNNLELAELYNQHQPIQIQTQKQIQNTNSDTVHRKKPTININPRQKRSIGRSQKDKDSEAIEMKNMRSPDISGKLNVNNN